MGSSQITLPDNTHKRETSMPPVGIRTHNLSRRANADQRLRPRGHWDRHNIMRKNNLTSKYFVKVNSLENATTCLYRTPNFEDRMTSLHLDESFKPVTGSAEKRKWERDFLYSFPDINSIFSFGRQVSESTKFNCFRRRFCYYILRAEWNIVFHMWTKSESIIMGQKHEC